MTDRLLGAAIVVAAFSPALVLIAYLHWFKKETMDPNPLYVHDCSHCTYLGTWWRASTNHYYDLYICPPRDMDSGLGPCLLARYDNEGGDYYSYSLASWDLQPTGLIPQLQEAFYRARVLELV